MPDPLENIVQLSDRVKELSYTEGTGNMSLEGAAAGFSAFSGIYAHSGLVYYAITDGVNYEVGSGHYLNAVSDPAISTDELRRYPFTSSSAGNAKVPWVAGTKEVYVTYPAAQSVYTADGVDPKYTQAASSGLAFWEADNTLNYDPSGVWDRVNKRLGVHTDAPESAIHVGGDKSYSLVTASGLRVDVSGVVFSGVSYATRQTEPFLRTQLDDYPTTITNVTGLLATSGTVDEYLLLVSQTAGQVFASPADDCVGGCEPGFPSFRALHTTDIPDLSASYVTTYGVPEPPSAFSGVAFYHTSGVLGWDSSFVWSTGTNSLGVGFAKPEATLHVGGDAIIDTDLTVKGDLDVRGDLTYINSSTVTIDDKNLELASLSGVAKYTDSYVDTGGISILSSGDGSSDTGDKRLYWENASNTWKTDIQRADASKQLIGITASGVVFDNGTQISGAYVGGSGISINGFNIDIGNMFSLGASPTQSIHQGDIIFVSGINGITSSMGSFPAEATATVTVTDFAELNAGDKVNLIATDGTNYDFTNGDQSSVAGTWESTTSNEVTATNLMNVINTSSGPAGTRFSASVDGAVVTITQSTGGDAGNTAITLTDGGSVGMTKTNFIGGTGSTHTVYLDPTQLSGVLNDDMISSGVAISGWARDAMVSSADLAQASGTLNARITAVSGYMVESGVAVSGWARDYINYTSGTLNDDMISSGVAVSGWARDYTLKASGYLNSDMIASGTAILAAASDTGETNQNAFSYISSDGYTVPADAKTDTFIVASGHDNSVWASGNGVDTITISGAHNFFLRGDSDAGAGGSQVLHNDAVTMSGGYGITTTRAGDLVAVAWSGASYVDAGDLAVSGWARDYADTRVLATGVAANAYTDTTSGTLNADMISSGIAVSGWARDYADTRVLATGVAANAYTDTTSGTLNADMISSGVAVSGWAGDAIYNSGVAISGWVVNSLTYDWLSDPGTLTAMTDTTMEGDDTLIIWDEGNSLWKKVTLTELDDEIGAGADVGDVNESSFKTISVALQDSVVAENDADELTLVGGTNVTITTNATTDTITFVSTDTTYSIQDGELSQNNFTNADHTKLDGIEASATADQSNAEIKTAIEAGTDIALGGNPTTTTQSAGDSSTKIATTAFVVTEVAALVDSAPGTLDTLNELAAALGNDASFSTTVTNSIATKMPLAGGAFTGAVTTNSTFDGRDVAVDGAKLDGIEASATADQTAGEILTLLEDGIDSVHYKDGSIDNEHIADDAINSEHYAAASIDTEHIADAQITTGKIALDAINGTLIADNAINSEHYAAGSIDNEHLANGVVDSDQIAAGAIDLAHMSANSVDSDQYVDGSIDLAHMSADSVDGTKIADDSIDSEHIVDDSIDGSHIGSTNYPTDGQILSASNILGGGAEHTFTWIDSNSYTSGDGIVVNPDNTIDMHEDWYRFDEDSDSTHSYGIAIGKNSDAYGNTYIGTTTQYNHSKAISIGYGAGQVVSSTHQRGAGLQNINIGTEAGKDDLRGQHLSHYDEAPLHCINIGTKAGANPVLAAHEGTAPAENIFIGKWAGRYANGIHNITIGSFDGVTKDYINNHFGGMFYVDGTNLARRDYKLNIANTIAGDISTDSTYKKRIAIGAISTTWGHEPIATLELKGEGTLASASTFHIARSTSTQAGSFFTAETLPATYNGTILNHTLDATEENIKNEIVNKDGFLRVPIFKNLADLKATLGAASTANMGVVAMYYVNNDNNWQSVNIAFSTGDNWVQSGHHTYVL
jgi:hypothetical protein